MEIVLFNSFLFLAVLRAKSALIFTLPFIVIIEVSNPGNKPHSS